MIRRDLQDIGVREDVWYGEEIGSREAWRSKYRRVVSQHVQKQATQASERRARDLVCEVCARAFQRESDLK